MPSPAVTLQAPPPETSRPAWLPLRGPVASTLVVVASVCLADDPPRMGDRAKTPSGPSAISDDAFAAAAANPQTKKRIEILEKQGGDTTAPPEKRIKQIVTIGLAQRETDGQLRFAARRLLTRIAAANVEGAVAVIERARKLDIADLLTVALAIDPEAFASDGGAAVKEALADLLLRTDEKAASAAKHATIPAQAARLAGQESRVTGDTAAAVRVLAALAALEVFEEGPKNDPRSLDLSEGLVDGLTACLHDPCAFGLMLDTVWPRVDREPRLEAWKDKGSLRIQAMFERIIEAVHAHTLEFKGLRPEPWAEWWHGLDDDARAAALFDPSAAPAAGLAGGVFAARAGAPAPRPVPSATAELRSDQPYDRGVATGQARKVVIVCETFWGYCLPRSIDVADNNVARDNVVGMIRNLPEGTLFTVIRSVGGDLEKETWQERNMWRTELVAADASTKTGAIQWVMREPNGLLDFNEKYQQLGVAFGLNADEVIVLHGCRAPARENVTETNLRSDSAKKSYDHQIDAMDTSLLFSAFTPACRRSGTKVSVVLTNATRFRDEETLARWAAGTGGSVSRWYGNEP